MSKEYSPFTPGAPVPLHLFVGRQNEVKQIIDTVKESIHYKRAECLFVEGIRGIGKSSLCTYAMATVEKDTRALVVSATLGGIHTLQEFVRHVFDAIVQTKGSNKWYESIRKIFEKHVENLDIWGVDVRFRAGERDIEGFIANFPGALRTFLHSFPEKERPDGLVFVLDDINGLASKEEFANWFKSLVDRLATAREREPLPVTFIFVGLPERRQELIRQQQSLDRVFDIVKVPGLLEEEARTFFSKAFESVNVQIQDDALDSLALYSILGYPVFIHEIGDAVFKEDVDNIVDLSDVVKGVFRATTIIGDKYIGPNVLQVISSERYKIILRKLHLYWDKYKEDFGKIIRVHIKEILDNNELTALDNFLRKMTELNVIYRIGGNSSGVYNFDNIFYVLYFQFMMQSE